MGRILKNPLIYILLLFLQILLVFSFFSSTITEYSINEVYALNKINYWDFASATGWTGTNDDGTNICGDNNSSTGDLAFSTAAVTSGTFQAVTPSGKNANYRSMVSSTFTAPGTGDASVWGKMSYYAAATSFGVSGNNWFRLDIYDSTNTTYVGNLFCLSYTGAQNSTSSYGDPIALTGGTTYAVRATLRIRLGSTNNSVATVRVDNIDVNSAPTGLSTSSVTDSTYSYLSWTTSTAGTGANGLHATTPYKVYRDTSSPVSTFLANSSTNSYTDSSAEGNTTYYYAISDYDTASAESPLSAESSVLTRPGAPTSLSFSNITSSGMRISWNAPTNGATNYKIDRCTGTGCSNFSNVATSIGNTYYDDSNLDPYTVYRYRVAAYNASGYGAYSTAAEETTLLALSISLTSDGTINYGNISMGTSKSTIDLTDTQVVHNDGSSAIGLNIKTSNATASSSAFLYDYTTNTNDGTPTGTTYLSSGKAEGARSLNGSSDYIEVPDHNTLDLTSAGTIEAWVYKTSQTATPSFVSKGHTQAYQLTEYLSTGRLALKWGSDTEAVISDSAIPTGEWVHVAGVYNGSKAYLYVNGYEVKNADYTTNAVANNTPLRIGARDDGSYLTGYIDEVHISNIARTPTEILNHFNSVVIQPDQYSVALWHLDETPWALGASAGTNIFKHEFSSTSGSSWSTFTAADSYQQFVASLAGDTSQNLDLRITVPTLTSDFTQKNISITIQAVAL